MYKTIIEGNKIYYYLDYGSQHKSVLLFLHGYADSALMFSKLALSLSHKYRVVCLDFPMIHEPTTIQSLRSLADYVNGFVEALDLENFVLVGFSLGGSVAIELVGQKDLKVDKLYLLNSVPQFLPSKTLRIIYRFLKPVLKTKAACYLYSRLNTNMVLRSVFRGPTIKQTVLARMREYPVSVFGTLFNIIDADLTQKFKSISIPKTVVLFKDDTVVPWERYKRHLEEFRASLVVFDKGWHAARREYWENIKSLWLGSYQKGEFVREKLEL